MNPRGGVCRHLPGDIIVMTQSVRKNQNALMEKRFELIQLWEDIAACAAEGNIVTVGEPYRFFHRQEFRIRSYHW